MSAPACRARGRLSRPGGCVQVLRCDQRWRQDAVEARFSIADGYYLYRERFGFAASDGAQLGAPQYPTGKIKFDETFNRQLEIYRGDVVVKLPVQAASGPFTLTAKLQGCADQGMCYPPETRTAQLSLGSASSMRQPPVKRWRAVGRLARRRHRRMQAASKPR